MKLIPNERPVNKLPRLTLEQYRTLASHVERPSSQQIRDFAEYVSGAKSWYKHLPVWPPGTRFNFYLDPNAGLDRLVDPRGRVFHFRRTDETPQFHYTWMTTDAYRSRYGRLAFATEAGTRIMMPLGVRLADGRDFSAMLDNNPKRPTVHLDEHREYQLPLEVLEAGGIDLTAVIHALAARPRLWLTDGGGEPTWPEETGGWETAQRIIAVCNRLRAEPRQPHVDAADNDDKSLLIGGIDPELDELIAPERERLRRAIVAAVESVTEVTFAP